MDGPESKDGHTHTHTHTHTQKNIHVHENSCTETSTYTQQSRHEQKPDGGRQNTQIIKYRLSHFHRAKCIQQYFSCRGSSLRGRTSDVLPSSATAARPQQARENTTSSVPQAIEAVYVLLTNFSTKCSIPRLPAFELLIATWILTTNHGLQKTWSLFTKQT